MYPGFDVCPGRDPSCPEAVILEMYERWRPLSQTCDHRAVFALTYLRTTEEYFRTVTETGVLRRPAMGHHEDATSPSSTSTPRTTSAAPGEGPGGLAGRLRRGRSPNVTGAGDLFLGMSAHINRDLP